MKLEFYRDKRGDWRWRLRAGNNKSIAVPVEGYVRRIDCRSSAALALGGQFVSGPVMDGEYLHRGEQMIPVVEP